MSSKIINVVLFALLSLSVVGNANAGLIIGEYYKDKDNIEWEYIGSYDLVPANGEFTRPSQGQIDDGASTDVRVFNGLEAAMYVLGLNGNMSDYAISTMPSIIASFGTYTVNHLAWYDIYDKGTSANDEAYSEASDFYDAEDVHSALVRDRNAEGSKINYVFKTSEPSASVPEPSTLAIFSLAICGLVARRFKK